MKKKTYNVYIWTLVVSLILVNGVSAADRGRGGVTYEVTITNLTRGQIFSPPIVISHDGDYRLFSLGDPASAQLYPLAEDGDTGPLRHHLGTMHPDFAYTTAEDILLPGNSVTLEITTHGRFRFISAAGMLVTTNDAFFAVQGERAPLGAEVFIPAVAYDAGSEANSELCAYIPGPPCANGGVHDDDNSPEGYVHIHAGVQGTGDLIPAMHDWRNPVAAIRIRPISR